MWLFLLRSSDIRWVHWIFSLRFYHILTWVKIRNNVILKPYATIMYFCFEQFLFVFHSSTMRNCLDNAFDITFLIFGYCWYFITWSEIQLSMDVNVFNGLDKYVVANLQLRSTHNLRLCAGRICDCLDNAFDITCLLILSCCWYF